MTFNYIQSAAELVYLSEIQREREEKAIFEQRESNFNECKRISYKRGFMNLEREVNMSEEGRVYVLKK